MTKLHRFHSIGQFIAVAVLLAGCDEAFIAHDEAAAAYEAGVHGWLDWALAQPHSTASPIADTTGEFCANGQPEEVWFLAGTFNGGDVERTCTIPADRPLFFPLVNRWTIDPDNEIDDEEAMDTLVGWTTKYFKSQHKHLCALTLRLDGEDLLGDDLHDADEATYTALLEPFVVDINADNWATQFGFAGGPTPTLSDGNFALLAPLEIGEHELELGGQTCHGNDVLFTTSVVYHLTVE